MRRDADERRNEGSERAADLDDDRHHINPPTIRMKLAELVAQIALELRRAYVPKVLIEIDNTGSEPVAAMITIMPVAS